ncbi:hypothetical protein GCM10007140_32280 [Priestia taiwanensis]|uniref:Uncharacterized protein n=1 Tax=Priestia taiwanensis TaxID=1347902 RepID=A0A917AWB2_9BACI|nr:hypothetical protein GCM10007140_32280 [Priestia taiwanensis]
MALGTVILAGIRSFYFTNEREQDNAYRNEGKTVNPRYMCRLYNKRGQLLI